MKSIKVKSIKDNKLQNESFYELNLDIGEVLKVPDDEKEIQMGDHVLFPCQPDSTNYDNSIYSTQIVRIPNEWSTQKAYLFPPLIVALKTWDELKLELGELALISSYHPFVNIFLQVALWRGAIPVIYLGRDQIEMSDIRNISIDLNDLDHITNILKREIDQSIGFAAIDFSGKSDIIDIILNNIPKWGRMMFAGEKSESLTIDYYNHFHRSGATIFSTILDFSLIFNPLYRNQNLSFFNNAHNILSNENMYEKLVLNKL